MPWREKLKNNISTVEQLNKHIDLSTKERKKIQKIIEKHPMSISQYYMSLIQEKGSYDHDPIKRMIVP
ncbi:KamA family radical SAM protein, partial [candidate division WOR-3 bacterium]|nr:KamA family radical SAM protein [candidate division WOR-3 bacterium]